MDTTPWDPEGVELLLDADGRLTHPDAAAGVDLRALYKLLVAARSLDLRLSHLGLPMWASAAGEEAALVSLGAELREADWLYPSTRDAAALLGRGITPAQIAQRVLALDGAPHLAGDFGLPELQVAPVSESVGLSLLLATGHARAQKLSGSGAITAASFGEGTTTTGAYHEAMCIAGQAELPVVFVCKTQMWPEGAPAEAGAFGDPVADRASVYGWWSRRTDGADPLATARAVQQAVARTRAGDGPSLVEVVVTQLTHDAPGHRDPIERLRRKLDTDGVWTQTFQDVIEASARKPLDRAIARWAELGGPAPQGGANS